MKTWLVEVALKKIGPTAMASGISALLAFLAAHQGLLEAWGITVGDFTSFATFHPTGKCVLIELDTVSSAALTALGVFITAAMVAAQHHVVAAVTGAPQSGDMRKVDIPGNVPTRKTDAPKASIKGVGNMNPLTILIVLLILAMVFSVPHWPYATTWGYYPSGGIGFVVLVLIILAIFGRL